MSLVHIGIALAFVAMLCWGFGDFLIQRATRKIGDWESLFAITAFGAVILLPFVFKEMPAQIFSPNEGTIILFASSVILFIAAILDFEGLREGKLSVIEPIWSFEVPVSALLAFFILGERLTWLQILFVVSLLAGLVLVSFRGKFFSKKFFLEKGVMVGIAGAIMMGAANFFMGWSSRVSDPIMANFFTDVFIAVVCFIYLAFRGKIGRAIKDIISARNILLPMSIADKVAWVAFAFAMSLAPIGVAVALSESYIIIAVILGLAVNREKIQPHQKFGLALAIFSAIILAAITT